MPKLIYVAVLQTTKRVIKMAEAQVVLTFVKFLLGSYYGYVLFINIDNVKGWILIALAAVMGVVKIYFSIKKGQQALREKEYHLWEMEREKRRKDRAETQA